MRLKLCAAALATTLALGACGEQDKGNQLSTDPTFDDAEVNAALGGIPPGNLGAGVNTLVPSPAVDAADGTANDAGAANAAINGQ